jgi:hypothetical protein
MLTSPDTPTNFSPIAAIPSASASLFLSISPYETPFFSEFELLIAIMFENAKAELF